MGLAVSSLLFAIAASRPGRRPPRFVATIESIYAETPRFGNHSRFGFTAPGWGRLWHGAGHHPARGPAAPEAQRGVREARQVRPALRAVQRGRLAAFGAAASFGGITTLARLSYDAGGSSGAVVLARVVIGTIAVATVVAALNRPWSIPRREWAGTALVTLAWTANTIGYMSSVLFIPVSLAVLVLFTFPVLVALIAPMVERRPPQAISLAAAALAFAGLALALGPDLGALDWRGVTLAFVASLGIAATFILSRRLVVEQDIFAFSFHVNAGAAIILVIVYTAFVGVTFPATASGWGALAGVSACYVTAVLLQFGAIRLAGPDRTSLVFNTEPIVTMIAAALLLGELLGPAQMVGAALVVGAVLIAAHADQ